MSFRNVNYTHSYSRSMNYFIALLTAGFVSFAPSVILVAGILFDVIVHPFWRLVPDPARMW